MLCPRCGTNVGASAQLCDACRRVSPKIVDPNQAEPVDFGSPKNPNVGHDGDIAPAGFWWRFFAVMIDQFILNVVFSALGLAGLIATSLAAIPASLNIFKQADPGSVPSALLLGTMFGMLGVLVVALLGFCFYGPLFESSKFKATPGKLIMGLVVTDRSDSRVSFWRALARNLCKVISALPFMLGYLLAAITAEKRALHDMLAGCKVQKRLEVSFGRRLTCAILILILALAQGSCESGKSKKLLPPPTGTNNSIAS